MFGRFVSFAAYSLDGRTELSAKHETPLIAKVLLVLVILIVQVLC